LVVLFKKMEFNKIRLEPVSIVISDWIVGPCFSGLLQGPAFGLDVQARKSRSTYARLE
jgi:hypothetical protein